MKGLLNGLCNKVEIDGTEYEINTDFSVWIEIEHIIFAREHEDAVALAKILALAFPVLPANPEKALERLFWFYSAGEETSKSEGTSAAKYDLVLDFDYVWGSFLAEFGIDLCKTKMHWWKFRALLLCLSESCRFSQIVGYRTMDLSHIKDKQKREFYERMKNRFRLPDRRTDEEKEQETAKKMERFF
ncbi:MAG: hypothetical protein IKW64_01130 [Clostridia bacterium]|nr:hypothetical protein [Clostridia bacterium]